MNFIVIKFFQCPATVEIHPINSIANRRSCVVRCAFKRKEQLILTRMLDGINQEVVLIAHRPGDIMIRIFVPERIKGRWVDLEFTHMFLTFHNPLWALEEVEDLIEGGSGGKLTHDLPCLLRRVGSRKRDPAFVNKNTVDFFNQGKLTLLAKDWRRQRSKDQETNNPFYESTHKYKTRR